jgi:hypothetical protein
VISEHARHNFNTLLRAARNGDLALLECADTEGDLVDVVCAVNEDAEAFEFVPIALMPRDVDIADLVQPPLGEEES